MGHKEDPEERDSFLNEDGTIKVAIADDHRVFSRSLATILAAQPDIEVAGEAHTGEEIVALCSEKEPDVVLMDVSMPVMDGITATREICKLLPSTRVLILTVHDDDAHVFQGIKAGAQGYVLKDILPGDLIRAVRGIYAGEAILPPNIAWKVLSVFEGSETHGAEFMPTLTENEIEVVKSLVKGQSNEEIALELSIPETAMHNYISGIYEKLHIYDRSQVIVKAIRQGLVNVGNTV